MKHANSELQPVETLSKERPQPNILNAYILGSVLGQFAIHVATLILLSNYVYSITPPSDDIDLEGEFEPSLLNSAVYLMQLIQQVSTFAINYQGRPFRERIRENRGMYWGLLACSFVAFAGSTEFIPEMNERLRLVKFTSEFKWNLTILMVVDYCGCWVVEQIFKSLFSDYQPKDISIRRPDQVARDDKRRQEALDKAEKERIEAIEKARGVANNTEPP